MGVRKYSNSFEVSLHEDTLVLPLRWKRARLVFVDSMSDLFHEHVPESFIHEVFSVMREASQHRFQVLTKRSQRLRRLSSRLEWTHNTWMGVSVENDEYVFRIDDLRQTGACVKFVSFEPLLGPVRRADLTGIDWAIVGGESGPGARPMRKAWVLQIRDMCAAAGVPFFFKQWGGAVKKRNGRLLEGRTWDGMPAGWGFPV